MAQGSQNTLLSPRRDLRCGRGGERSRTASSSTTKHSMAALSVSTRFPRVHQKESSTSRTSRFSCTHTVGKTPVATPWSKTRVHLCKGHGQNNLNLAEEILCATEDPHKIGNTLHQQKKIGNATQGFFVEFKKRSKHCSSLFRGTVIHISVESWQSRAQLRYFFKAQWPNA